MKKTFVMLTLLSSLWKDDKRWQANVRHCIDNSSTDGWTLAIDDDRGEPVQRDYSCDLLEFVDSDAVTVYDFAGSEGEPERFYAKAVLVFRVKATGELCVLDSDDLYEF